jgi:tetratricopeptide (TPR) repeat protein
MHLGHAYVVVGRVAEGIALLEEGAAAGEAIRQMTGYPTTGYPARLARLADAYAIAGRNDDADTTARRALALAREHGRRADEALSLRIVGRIAAAARPLDASTAEQHLSHARDLATALGMRPLVAHCHFDLARLYRSVGRKPEADEHFTCATALYREMGMRVWLEKAEAEIAAVGQSPSAC